MPKTERCWLGSRWGDPDGVHIWGSPWIYPLSDPLLAPNTLRKVVKGIMYMMVIMIIITHTLSLIPVFTHHGCIMGKRGYPVHVMIRRVSYYPHVRGSRKDPD